MPNCKVTNGFLCIIVNYIIQELKFCKIPQFFVLVSLIRETPMRELKEKIETHNPNLKTIPVNIVLTFATKRKNYNHISRQFTEKWNSTSVITVIVRFIGEEIKKNIYSNLITLIWLNMIIINLICTLCNQCPLLSHNEQKSRILFWKLPFNVWVT